MLHRVGVTVFTGLALSIFLGGGVAVALLFGLIARVGSAPALILIVGSTLTLLVGIVVLFAFQLTVHVVTSHDLRRREGLERRRLEQWLRFCYEGGRLPQLGVASATALASLRELLDGPEGRQMAELYARHGFLRRDIRLAFRSRPALRAKALERLAKVKHEGSLPSLQLLISIAPKQVAIEALHVVARVTWATRDQELAKQAFLAALAAREFPSGVVQSALVLLDDVGISLVRDLLERRLQVEAALHAMWRSHLIDAAAHLLPYLNDDTEPEYKAAALRAVANLEYLPSGGEDAVRTALSAEEFFVRAQGAKAAITLEPEVISKQLYTALGDSNYWVRQNAAVSLRGSGKRGSAVLLQASKHHPDKFARDTARRVLDE